MMRVATSLAALLLAAPAAQADVLTCSDGAGHQIMVGQGSTGQVEGLSCSSGRAGVFKNHDVRALHSGAVPAEMRIAPETQKARDDDRRQILNEELKSEQAVLEEEIGRRNGASGDLRQNLELQIHRTEQNIAALNRELARVH